MKNLILILASTLLLSSCIGTSTLHNTKYVVTAIQQDGDACYCWLSFFDEYSASGGIFDVGIWVLCDKSTQIGDTLYLTTKLKTSSSDTVYVFKHYNSPDTLYYYNKTDISVEQ